jgi:hypothetical protein
MFGKKDKQPVATPWRVTSTGAVNAVEFTNPNAAEKFWQDLVEMYPNQVHSLWRDGKLIKHN